MRKASLLLSCSLVLLVLICACSAQNGQDCYYDNYTQIADRMQNKIFMGPGIVQFSEAIKASYKTPPLPKVDLTKELEWKKPPLLIYWQSVLGATMIYLMLACLCLFFFCLGSFCGMVGKRSRANVRFSILFVTSILSLAIAVFFGAFIFYYNAHWDDGVVEVQRGHNIGLDNMRLKLQSILKFIDYQVSLSDTTSSSLSREIDRQQQILYKNLSNQLDLKFRNYTARAFNSVRDNVFNVTNNITLGTLNRTFEQFFTNLQIVQDYLNPIDDLLKSSQKITVKSKTYTVKGLPNINTTFPYLDSDIQYAYNRVSNALTKLMYPTYSISYFGTSYSAFNTTVSKGIVSRLDPAFIQIKSIILGEVPSSTDLNNMKRPITTLDNQIADYRAQNGDEKRTYPSIITYNNDREPWVFLTMSFLWAFLIIACLYSLMGFKKAGKLGTPGKWSSGWWLLFIRGLIFLAMLSTIFILFLIFPNSMVMSDICLDTNHNTIPSDAPANIQESFKECNEGHLFQWFSNGAFADDLEADYQMTKQADYYRIQAALNNQRPYIETYSTSASINTALKNDLTRAFTYSIVSGQNVLLDSAAIEGLLSPTLNLDTLDTAVNDLKQDVLDSLTNTRDQLTMQSLFNYDPKTVDKNLAALNNITTRFGRRYTVDTINTLKITDFPASNRTAIQAAYQTVLDSIDTTKNFDRALNTTIANLNQAITQYQLFLNNNSINDLDANIKSLDSSFNVFSLRVSRFTGRVSDSVDQLPPPTLNDTTSNSYNETCQGWLDTSLIPAVYMILDPVYHSFTSTVAILNECVNINDETCSFLVGVCQFILPGTDVICMGIFIILLLIALLTVLDGLLTLFAAGGYSNLQRYVRIMRRGRSPFRARKKQRLFDPDEEEPPSPSPRKKPRSDYQEYEKGYDYYSKPKGRPMAPPTPNKDRYENYEKYDNYHNNYNKAPEPPVHVSSPTYYVNNNRTGPPSYDSDEAGSYKKDKKKNKKGRLLFCYPCRY